MTTKERQKARAMCTCGMVLGIYKIRFHYKTWNHHYYAGTLDKFNQQQIAKTVGKKIKIEKDLETL